MSYFASKFLQDKFRLVNANVTHSAQNTGIYFELPINLHLVRDVNYESHTVLPFYDN